MYQKKKNKCLELVKWLSRVNDLLGSSVIGGSRLESNGDLEGKIEKKEG